MVHLALDCDYDRLEYLANYDGLLRQILVEVMVGLIGIRF
jgi:hypothetical protein